MNYEMMICKIESLGEDAYMRFDTKNSVIHVTLEDFEGFDDEWNEIDREYTNPEAVEAFEEMLSREAISYEGDFYQVFHFDGFDVVLGYSSFDI